MFIEEHSNINRFDCSRETSNQISEEREILPPFTFREKISNPAKLTMHANARPITWKRDISGA